ncbi:hypothetical protein GCM10010403_41660 [Glycomyces rutgersensis]
MGFAWFIGVLSGIATIFALFGGQQWLDEKGWTLSPSTATESVAADADDSGDPGVDDDQSAGSETEGAETASPSGEGATADVADDGADQADSASGLDSAWVATTSWSASTFDNLFWGIVAIGISMLISGVVGVVLWAVVDGIDFSERFFPTLLALVSTAVVVLAGILLHTADAGYMLWFIILTSVCAVGGFMTALLSEI